MMLCCKIPLGGAQNSKPKLVNTCTQFRFSAKIFFCIKKMSIEFMQYVMGVISVLVSCT